MKDGWKKTKGDYWMVDMDYGRERYYTGTICGEVLLIPCSIVPNPQGAVNKYGIDNGDRVLEAINIDYDGMKRKYGIRHYRKGHIVL